MSFKRLRNVLHGLHSHVLSRHWECDGYWAFGIIVGFGCGTGSIDLLHGEGHGLLRDPRLRTLVDHCCIRFFNQLARARIAPVELSQARIVITVLDEVRPSRRGAEPEHAVDCRCEAVFVDGRSAGVEGRTWASAHDPHIDIRSGRADSED